MKPILFSSLALLSLFGCRRGEPYGFYFTGEKKAAFIRQTENPFLPPDSDEAGISGILLFIPQFEPVHFQFFYRALPAQTERRLWPKFYPSGEKDTYRVVFPEPLPPGGTLVALQTKDKNIKWAGFVGGHKSALLAICENVGLEPMEKLNLVNQYNQAYPQQPLLDLVVRLENEIEDRRFQNALAEDSPIKLQTRLLEYLETYPSARHVAEATKALELINRQVEDRVLTEAIQDQGGGPKVEALTYLMKIVSGWNHAGTAFALADAMLEWDDRTFEDALSYTEWHKKRALEQYLNRFPEGVNRAIAVTMLDEVNARLDPPAYRNAIDIKSTEAALEALHQYLKDFPNGIHQQEALAQIDHLEAEREKRVFNEAMARRGLPRKQGLESYLSAYPKGRWRSEAERALAEIRAQLDEEAYRAALVVKDLRQKVKALENYILDYPDGRFYDEAKTALVQENQKLEQQFFQAARKQSSRADRRRTLRDYLVVYPNGAYKEEALRLLKELGELEVPKLK